MLINNGILRHFYTQTFYKSILHQLYLGLLVSFFWFFLWYLRYGIISYIRPGMARAPAKVWPCSIPGFCRRSSFWRVRFRPRVSWALVRRLLPRDQGSPLNNRQAYLLPSSTQPQKFSCPETFFWKIRQVLEYQSSNLMHIAGVRIASTHKGPCGWPLSRQNLENGPLRQNIIRSRIHYEPLSQVPE